ncbi:MAG: BspA family leucine-rich repeat surface protein [Cyclobacteriaceae bacterium]|nr:BspA family leucine-rich repeat surface protein [Cyclobacteriaceae bacterium]MCH8515978.1 BspA family leucine-rich repeat surface protein [Cyclobacteriaceae bacterium]
MNQFYFLMLLITILHVSNIHAQEKRPFITTWETTQADEEIVIPIIGSGSNYTVDWGDGSIEEGLSENANHTYTSPATYQVTISGEFNRIFFGISDINNKRKLKSIDQWGDIEWSNMSGAFNDCQNLQILAEDAPDLSRVTDMSFMFFRAFSFNENINHWDVSNITNMDYLFASTSAFDQELSDWDVSKVESMSNMFATSAFNQNINDWDVGEVRDMSLMFRRNSAFNQDLNSWNVGNVTTMRWMFYEASAFNGDITAWDVGNVEDMSLLFLLANAFNQDIGNWNVSNVTNMERMFSRTLQFNQNLNGWDVSKVTNMERMFSDAFAFNQDLNDWDVSQVTNMNDMFGNLMFFNGNISDWDVSNVEDMGNMFSNNRVFNQDISRWDVSKVTNMANMFNTALEFNQNISNWDVSGVENMRGMFNNAEAFNQAIGNWDVSAVKNMSSMLNNAISFDQDISNWDISNVSDMRNLLNNVSISTQDFDRLLDRWSQLPSLVEGVTFGAQGLTFCESSDQQQLLIDNWNWMIVGAVQNCTQEIKFEELQTRTLGDEDFEIVAMASSGLPVTFTSSDESIATIAGNIVTLLGSGTVEIIASQEGNDLWEPAENITRSLEVAAILSNNNKSNNWSSRVYPNPTTDQLYIESEEPIYQITLYTLAGRLILHEKIDDNKKAHINLSQQKEGVYLLKINDIAKSHRVIKN